eukprot:22957-Amphidinium_carterae.1
MTRKDHRDYSKLVCLECLQEEDPIPSWALEMKAPNAPVVYDAETSRRNGLAWTYCKAGPPIDGANRTRYELKTVLPKNTDVNQVLQLQKVKDKAIHRRQEMLIMGRSRTDELEDEFHSLKKTNDGSICLVCFRCWNEFENTD